MSRLAAAGSAEARRQALELDEALKVLSSFDEGADLVLYYKFLTVLTGDEAYARQIDPTDALSDSQRNYAETQFRLFTTWYREWVQRPDVAKLRGNL